MKKRTGWKPIPREEPLATETPDAIPFASWLASPEALQSGTIVANTNSILSPKSKEPRNTPNTRKKDIPVRGFFPCGPVCSVVKKNGIAAQPQDHLPNRIGGKDME